MCREGGVGEAPSASPCLGNFPALSKIWLQLCSSNTGLGFILIFVVLDDFGICSPARSMQGALSSPGRAGKGLELLCSPFWGQASEEGWDLFLPAQHCWHLEGVPGGMESPWHLPGGTQERFPVLCSAGTLSSWSSLCEFPAVRPALLTSGSFPLLLFLLFAPQRQSRGSKSCFCKAL